VAGVAVKAVPWAFVVGGTRFATNSLIGNANLLTKIYLPREIFPLAAVGSQLVDLAVAAIPLAFLLAVARVGLSVHVLWVPLIIGILILQVAAFGILFSAGSLFFRDVKYLVDMALTFAIFVTPVFFDVDLFGRWRAILLLNPLAPLLDALTTCLLRHAMPDLSWLAYSAGVGVLAMSLAVTLFHRWEPYFAEYV
jgi:ABC-type polysaccharide/polyol phosphate export permease